MERTPEMLLLAYTDILNSIVDTFIARESDNEHIKDKMPELVEELDSLSKYNDRQEERLGKDSPWVKGEHAVDKVMALIDFLVVLVDGEEEQED